MREQNTAALVLPAHTLKGESRQLGAEPLAKVAELIETTARFCVESRRFPDELVPEVVELRRLFDQTIELFDKATNPLMTRAAPGGFGRKAGNQSFGRITRASLKFQGPFLRALSVSEWMLNEFSMR